MQGSPRTKGNKYKQAYDEKLLWFSGVGVTEKGSKGLMELLLYSPT